MHPWKTDVEPAELCSLYIYLLGDITVCSWPDTNITYVECCFFLCFCSTPSPNVQGWESLTGQIQRRLCLFSLSLPEVGPSLFTQKCGHSVGSNTTPTLAQFRTVYLLSQFVIWIKWQKDIYQFIEKANRNICHTHTVPLQAFTFCILHSASETEWTSRQTSITEDTVVLGKKFKKQMQGSISW